MIERPGMSPKARFQMIKLTVIFYAGIGAAVYWGWFA